MLDQENSSSSMLSLNETDPSSKEESSSVSSWMSFTMDWSSLNLTSEEESLTPHEKALFLLEKGKGVYNSWTSSDGGLLEFTACLKTLQELDDVEDLILETLFWIGKAQYKSRHYDDAAESYKMVIDQLETSEGRYTMNTAQAYHLLSTALLAAGKVSEATHAGLVAARIEQIHYGPFGPLETRSALEQTWTRHYAYSPSMIEGIWQNAQDSLSLELQGDHYVLLQDFTSALEAYTEAALTEARNFGKSQNRNLVLLYRKAAVLPLKPTTPSNILGQEECPSLFYPRLCSKLAEADQAYTAGNLDLAADSFRHVALQYKHMLAAGDIEVTSWQYPAWLVPAALTLVLSMVLLLANHIFCTLMFSFFTRLVYCWKVVVSPKRTASSSKKGDVYDATSSDSKTESVCDSHEDLTEAEDSSACMEDLVSPPMCSQEKEGEGFTVLVHDLPRLDSQSMETNLHRLGDIESWKITDDGTTALVTFVHEEDAIRCIRASEGKMEWANGKVVIEGTTTLQGMDHHLAASVESLGKVLAEFETSLDLDDVPPGI